MNRFFLLALIVCLFSYPCFAKVVGKVSDFDKRQHLVAVDFTDDDHGVKESDFIFIPFPGGYKCRLEVIKVLDEAVVAVTRHCARESMIKKGQTVETDPYGDNRETYPPPSPIADPGPIHLDNILQRPMELAPQEGGNASENEWWYTYWGMGLAVNSYPSQEMALVNRFNQDPALNHFTLGLDVLGIYLPQRNFKTMIGTVFSIVMDRWNGPTGSYQLNQYAFLASAMHFFGTNIGDGPFIRGDVGPAWRTYSQGGDGLGRDERETYFGFALLLGGGYALPIRTGTRILFQLNYVLRLLGQTTQGTAQLSAGLLF